ncbi:MAG: helix-turn-helix domain-containing protein [Sphingobacteriaceae bacterium]
MISREELIYSKEYWMASFQAELYNEVEAYLKSNKLSKTAFAAELGVSKGYISQLMNADFDHKISKLIELSLAIGKAPVLEFKNLNDFVARTVQKEVSRAEPKNYIHATLQSMVNEAEPPSYSTKKRK